MTTEVWSEGNLAGFDLETTGPDPLSARIVTASVVVIDAAGNTVEEAHWLVAPEETISEDNASIHGITDEYAREHGMSPKDAVAEICSALSDMQSRGITIVTHNGQYDFTVLDRESRRNGHEPFIPTMTVDTIVLDRHFDKYRKGRRTLSAVAAHYGVEFEGDAHTSDADCRVAVGVSRKIADKFPASRMPAEQLTKHQVGMAQQQLSSLKTYLMKKNGSDVVVHTEWPIIPFMDGATADPDQVTKEVEPGVDESDDSESDDSLFDFGI